VSRWWEPVIAGNSAAWTLSKGYTVTVYDRELRPGGSRCYVDKLTLAFCDRIRLGCAVNAIERTPHGVVIHDSHGHGDSYDHVVLACHSDQALDILSDADERERAILGAIGYSPNTVYLHRDERLMPKRKRVWASWNFLRWQREDEMANDVAVTYWMNNTFGEIHPYVLPVRAGELGAAGVRQEQDKLFHVSPFVGMAMRYRFRIVPPGEQVKLRILETDCEGPLLAATFIGRRRVLSTRALFRAFVALPLVTAKILAAIHWEALRLWLKGTRLVTRPDTATANADSGLANRETRAYIS
jgi:hypothetical protein